MDLRWARGCGTGIGLSGHKNAYPPVVAVNNFLEDRSAADKDCKWYKFGKIEPANSTYQSAHNRSPEQVAAALGNCTAKIPREILKQDKGKTILFEHLGPRQQPPDTYVSVNSLTYSTPHLDKRHVHTELWCGAKANDLNVTQKQAPAGQLTADKKTSWSAHATPERNTKYASSTRSTQMQTALLSDPRKRDCKAAATNATAAPGSGCQQPTIGRKVTGEMSVWVDRNERMMTMLDFRKPIDYTVTLTCKDAVTGNAEEVVAKDEEAACHAPDEAYGIDPAHGTQQATQHAPVC